MSYRIHAGTLCLVVAGCSAKSIDLDQLRCEGNECATGYDCHPETGLCVPEIAVGCHDATSLCPSEVQTGDVCATPGAFIPCVDGAADCEYGCRTCQADGTWSACSAGSCQLGQLTSCGACNEDCTSQVLNATPICNTSGSVFVCDYEGECTSGFANADGDRANGCEATCVPTHGGVEVCDGVDNDCNGPIDDMLPADVNSTCDDAISDNHVTTWQCSAGQCQVTQCVDGYIDLDGLGQNGCEYACVISNKGVETCDGADNDCNGDVDDVSDLLADCNGWLSDPPGVSTYQCDSASCGGDHCCVIAGCIAGKSDADGNPGNGCETDCIASGTEVCDDKDNDCNGIVDDAAQNADGCRTFYRDVDGDGFGVTGDSQCWCLPTGDYRAVQEGDCNDGDASISPGEIERVADGIDQNCNGKELCYVDGDDDGYRPNDSSIVRSANLACTGSGEAVASDPSGDCRDDDASIHPGATEGVADGVDQDCNDRELCYVDGDDDGYRPDDSSTVESANLACTDSGEAVASDPSGDCADDDPNRHPGAAEACNNLDDNCDAVIDGDPPVANCQCAGGGSPLPAEDCTNDVDDDCNGKVNDGCAVIRPSNLGSVDLCQNTEALNLVGTTAILVTNGDGSLDISGLGALVTETIQQDDGMPDITVFYFDSITIDSASLLHISGTPALALVSCTDIVIDGTVTACATGQQGGAGGYVGGGVNAKGAGPGAGGGGTGDDDQHNYGGGGGGGYCGTGGWGGSAGQFGGYAAGGAVGVRYENPDIVPLVGGSGGGGGAESQDGTKVGGGGGGAVQLVANGSIAISGVITACGAGGGGPTADGDAGGGGGSGGAILVEASTVTLASTAVIAANGGGGGGGDDYGEPKDVDTTGEDGPAEARRAEGGEHGGGANQGSENDAGDGGKGGALTGADINGSWGGWSTNDSYSGGGGGGAAGYIRINTDGAANLSIEDGAVLSPSGLECYSRGDVAFQ